MLTKQKMKKLIIILSVMSVLSLMCIFHSFLHPLFVDALANQFNLVTNKDNLMVHFINVEQADAVAINLPDGKIMLIDDGSKDINVDYVNYLKENVIHSKINNKIDYLVLTHADADHVGGTMKLLKNFEINMVFMPKIISNSATFQEIYDYVTKNCDYQVLGEGFQIVNQYQITFFESLNQTNTNDSSQVIKLEYLNKSFLFMGDVSSLVEDDYVEFYGNSLNCDVLKVSHHGSSTATSQLLLDYSTPQYAVISVGENNSYGHPNEEVLNRLRVNGVNIYRTDKHGDVLFVVGSDYNLKVLNNTYFITGLTLDYRIYILIIDIIMFGVAVVVILKKEKKKSKH